MLPHLRSLFLLAACLTVVRSDIPKPAPARTNPNVVDCGPELGHTARCNALVSDGQYRNFQSHRSPLILFERDDHTTIDDLDERDTIGDGKWFNNGGSRPWVRDTDGLVQDDDAAQSDEDDTGEAKWFRSHPRPWKRDDDDEPADDDPNDGDDLGEEKWFHRGHRYWKKEAGDDTGDEKWFNGGGGSRYWKREDIAAEDGDAADQYIAVDDQGDIKWFSGGSGIRAWKRVEWTDSSESEM